MRSTRTVRPQGANLLLHLKRRTLLRPTLPAIIEPRGGYVGIPEPLLHLGNVRIVRTRTRPV